MGRLKNLTPALAMIVLQVIYAGLYLMCKLAFEEGLNIRVFIVYRQASAILVLAPVALFLIRRQGSSSWALTWKSFLWLFLNAFVGVTVNNNIYFEGLYLASASVASAAANLIPALTFTTAVLLRLEKVNFRSLSSNAKIIGAALCVGGAMVMTFLKGSKLFNSVMTPSKMSISVSLGTEHWILGCLCLFASTCLSAVWLIMQVYVIRCHPNSMSISFWTCLFSLLQSAVIALVFERDLSVWIVKPNMELLACIYSGIFAAALAYFLQAWCISVKGPVFSAMFSPVCTITVTVIACLFFAETLYLGSLLGAIAVIIGLYLVLWGKAEEAKTCEARNDEPSIEISSEDDLENPLLPPNEASTSK